MRIYQFRRSHSCYFFIKQALATGKHRSRRATLRKPLLWATLSSESGVLYGATGPSALWTSTHHRSAPRDVACRVDSCRADKRVASIRTLRSNVRWGEAMKLSARDRRAT